MLKLYLINFIIPNGKYLAFNLGSLLTGGEQVLNYFYVKKNNGFIITWIKNQIFIFSNKVKPVAG